MPEAFTKQKISQNEVRCMNMWWWALWTALQTFMMSPERSGNEFINLPLTQEENMNVHISFLGVAQQMGLDSDCRPRKGAALGQYCLEDHHRTFHQRDSRTWVDSHIKAVQALCWLHSVDSGPCVQEVSPDSEICGTVEDQVGSQAPEDWDPKWGSDDKKKDG